MAQAGVQVKAGMPPAITSRVLQFMQLFEGRSLRERIALLYGALFAIVLVAILLLVNSGIERHGEANAERDLAANARVFDEFLNHRVSEMESAANVLSRDFGFREAVATGDASTVASALRSIRKRSGTSAAFVIGMDGTLVTAGSRGLPPGEELIESLFDENTHGIMMVAGEPALAAASAIQAPDTIGWLVLAQPLDESEMAHLAELAAIDLEERIVLRSELDPELAAAPLGRVFERNGGGQSLQFMTALPTMQAGLEPRLVLSYPLGSALAEYNALKLMIVIISLAGLGLAIILGRRIAHAIEKAISQRERKIAYLGLHDGLTKLPNRKHFIEQLDAALAARQGAERVVAAYCDLDNFKMINDTFGHPAGDALLCAVADSFREAVPEGLVARLGGDEFAVMVIVPDPKADLTELAARIRDALVRQFDLPGRPIQNSGSVGLAVAPEAGTDSVELVKNADLALYRAKHAGKATFHFYDASLNTESRIRRELERDLRLAIVQGQLEIRYRPLTEIGTGKLEGFEAHLRWNHPEKGAMSAREVIRLAEEMGLIAQIGEWMLREACSIAQSWPDNLSLLVKISTRQFGAPGFESAVVQALAHAGLAPRRLELELSERIFVNDVRKTIAGLNALRELGVRISLDDFGKSYSSFSGMRNFPFDRVKIDRLFLNDIDDRNAASVEIVRSVATLADTLGMETMAQGIERAEQLEFLRANGCRDIGGLRVDEPLSAAVLADFIDEARMGSQAA